MAGVKLEIQVAYSGLMSERKITVKSGNEEITMNVTEEVGIPDMELPGVDEMVENRLLLGVLADAMYSLLPEEREYVP